ncbi:MAG: FGGY family carbohydrate kinase [Caulobacteraceae bacterium]
MTNQRETTVVWEKATGKPIANAIVWQDTRTDKLVEELGGEIGQDRFREICGLPLATYFSGPKVRWLLDNTPGARAAAERGELLFGTIDAWLIWNLTGRHVTDVTNASRSMLMALKTLAWDDGLLEAIGVPAAMLPQIRPSSEVYGPARGMLEGVPVASALGDQQAALFGQTCFLAGRGQVHLWHRQLPAGEHRRAAGDVEERPADHRRLPDRRRGAGLCLGRRDRGRWLAGAMGARQSRPDRLGRRDRAAGPHGGRQRRLLLRAGLRGPVRAALALRRPRRDRGPDRLCRPRATSPARCWRRWPGRRARWSTPWPPTPARR